MVEMQNFAHKVLCKQYMYLCEETFHTLNDDDDDDNNRFEYTYTHESAGFLRSDTLCMSEAGQPMIEIKFHCWIMNCVVLCLILV
jgi:hypothetical protein